MNYPILCLLLLSSLSDGWPQDDDIPATNEPPAVDFVNNTGSSKSENAVNGRAKRHGEVPGGVGMFRNSNGPAGFSSSEKFIKGHNVPFDGQILDFKHPSSGQMALLLFALESIEPDEIQKEYCPKLQHGPIDSKVQKQREELMTFLNRDVYRLIEVGSKLVDKIVDTCGQTEKNKYSIEIMRTVQNNFMEPILSPHKSASSWTEWKRLAFVLNAVENENPSEIQQYCPAKGLVYGPIDDEVQQAQKQVKTFLNKDVYKQAEAGSKFIDKLIEECGESDKTSIQIMRLFRDNFVKPILDNKSSPTCTCTDAGGTWTGCKLLAIVFIGLFIACLCSTIVLALMHFGRRGK